MSESARPRRGARRTLDVRDLGIDERECWSEFVRRTSTGSPYQLPAYLDTLTDAVGGTFRVVAAFRGDEVVGGVAVLERRRAHRLLATPRLLLYYNGFVVRDYETRYPSERTARRFEVMDGLASRLDEIGYGHIELRSRCGVTDARPLQAAGWSVEPSYSYVVSLSDLESSWARVDQNLRRLIERGGREGLTFDPEGDAEELYRLHVQTHARKGAPVYLPKDRFLAFVERLRAEGLGAVLAARCSDGRTAASQLVLLGHPVTHTVVAAADPELQGLGANPFLRWRSFEWLAESGATGNDLTDATPGPVERFKAQLGGDLTLCLVARRTSMMTGLVAAAGRGVGRLRAGRATGGVPQ